MGIRVIVNRSVDDYMHIPTKSHCACAGHGERRKEEA